MIHETYPHHRNPTEYLSANSQEFIQQYRETLAQPLNIRNHIESIAFPSEEEIIEERVEKLSAFILNPTDENNRWGQTIFAEPVSKDIIQTAFRPVFANNKLSVQLTPTTMDPSIHEETMYQKGTDLCIVQEDKGVYIPICGIDVTLGDRGIVKAKRNKPGFQSFACMPVIVLPLNELTFDQGKKNFTHYLNTHALTAVRRGIKNNNFYGLTKDDVYEWKSQLGDSFKIALDHCRNSLNKTNRYIQSYPYQSELFNLLDQMNQIMDKYAQHIKRLY